MVSCLSTMSNMTEVNLTFTLPDVTVEISNEYFRNLIRELEVYERVIVVQTRMDLKDFNIIAYLFLLLSVDDFSLIVERASSPDGER